MNFMNKKLNKKGFTLIEMLVVIAVIAILVSIIIPTVSNAGTKAKCATNAANLRSVKAEIVTSMLSTNQTVAEAVEAANTKYGTTGGTVKFYNVTVDGATTAGFLAEANGSDVKVTWNGLTVQDWAEEAGQES